MKKILFRRKYLLGLFLFFVMFGFILLVNTIWYVSIPFFVISAVFLYYGANGLYAEIIIKKCMRKGYLTTGKPLGEKPENIKNSSWVLYHKIRISYKLENGEERIVMLSVTYLQVNKIWEMGSVPVRVYKNYGYVDFMEMSKIINQKKLEENN